MLTIDKKTYRCRVIYPSLQNTFEIMEGVNSGTAQSGLEIRDILGTRYSYTLDIEPDPVHPQDFDALYEVLSAPVASHEVTLPYGQGAMTFQAAVSSGSRTYHGKTRGFERWKTMHIEFRPIRPQRMAGR